jgi:hypothetical protein
MALLRIFAFALLVANGILLSDGVLITDGVLIGDEGSVTDPNGLRTSSDEGVGLDPFGRNAAARCGDYTACIDPNG